MLYLYILLIGLDTFKILYVSYVQPEARGPHAAQLRFCAAHFRFTL